MAETTHREAIALRLIVTPAGPLLGTATAKGLRALEWGRPLPGGAHDGPAAPEAEAMLDRTAVQLAEYFAGSRRVFDVPLDPRGTPFQRKAWEALGGIPYGETRTYAEQAAAIGHAAAVRAIGAANGKNPLSILVPCHRVVGSNGSLTGYAGGIAVKGKLLALESRQGVLF